MSDLTTVLSPDAPAPAGPYSQAIAGQGLLFVSGQLPMDMDGRMPEGIEAQTRQSLANVRAVLAAGGSSLARIAKTTVYLADMNDFAAMNTIYADVFGQALPARSAFEVARLPRDARVEIECIAFT
ncbi:Rid family detoxifying hydrolase [Salinisphaera sp. T31B1]|uniref:RidA family protein n=1 Tax=Salinisphaera sp. T31B1 TaxID=727963 RepID=UPI00333F313F